MTATAEPIWDEQRRLDLGAIAAVIGAAVAIVGGGFRPQDWSMLPFAALGFVLKARWPRLPNMVMALPAMIAPLTINIIDTDFEFSMFLVVLSVTLLSSIEDDRRIANGYVIFIIVVIIVLTLVSVYDWDWVNWVAALSLSWAFGTAVYHYDRVLSELRATQAELVDHAALVERRRIARDVHDLIGHSLSVVMLHVAGARRLIRSDPDEAERALLQAEEASRASMAEVRRTVGLMRDDGEGDGATPAPDLTDIVAVVDQYRAAGLSIELDQSGPIEGVTGPVGVACHRIAQEALANVTKHTVGSDVEVEVAIEVDDAGCRLRVQNRGGRALDPVSDSTSGSGHGLIGMRERAQSVGGSLLVGPVPNGWSVEVTVPIDATGSPR